MAHTPGPWEVETVRTSIGVCHKIGPFPHPRPRESREHTYACVYEDGMSTQILAATGRLDSELLANARLIAAAPELLAALKGLIEDGAIEQALLEPGRVSLARAAISKAEGQPAVSGSGKE